MTALDLITRALQLINVVAEGQTVAAQMATDGLSALNEILDNWNTQGLATYATANDVVNLSVGVTTYTIGTGGTFNIDRPVRILAAYTTYQGLDYEVVIIPQDVYNLISLKTLQSPIIQNILYVNDVPLGRITVYPVPSATATLTLTNETLVASIANLGDTLVFPPGYSKALRYNLAVAMAIEYKIEPPPTLQREAAKAFGDIKGANMDDPIMRFDAALTGTPSGLPGFLAGYW